MAQPRELQRIISLYWCPAPLDEPAKLSILDDLGKGKLPILVTNLDCAAFQDFVDRNDVGRLVLISTGDTGLFAKISDRITYDIKPMWSRRSKATKLGVAEAVKIITGWTYTAGYIMDHNRTVFEKMDVSDGANNLAIGAPSRLQTLNIHLTD